jgi:hypothetical protein
VECILGQPFYSKCLGRKSEILFHQFGFMGVLETYCDVLRDGGHPSLPSGTWQHRSAVVTMVIGKSTPHPSPHGDVTCNAAVTWVTGNSGTDYVTGKHCDYISEPHCLRSELKCCRRRAQLKLVKGISRRRLFSRQQ